MVRKEKKILKYRYLGEKSTEVQQQGQFGARGVCTHVTQCSTIMLSFLSPISKPSIRNRSPFLCGQTSNHASRFAEVSGSDAPFGGRRTPLAGAAEEGSGSTWTPGSRGR